MEKLWPLTLTLPVRAEPVWLAASVTDTTAEAVPVGAGTVIQLVSDGVAVHAHPLGPVTAKVRVWAP